MKYTKEITDKMMADYANEVSVDDIAAELDVAIRSVISKFSSLGVYKKKQYTNKRGEVPIKKEEYIERIGALLDVNLDMLESLEKVNKSVLVMLEAALKEANEKTD